MRSAMLGAFCLVVPLAAWAGDDRWSSGFGQGLVEASVSHGPGNSITVVCNVGGNPVAGSAIWFELAGRPPGGDWVSLTFDGAVPERMSLWEGRITSDCPPCAGTFDHVVARLKAHSSVHVQFANGDGARFTLVGSAEAIGDCPSDLSQ